MSVFVLGDPHLSFSADKPMDIFGRKWKNHPKKIQKAWKKRVRPEDTVVLAGDISWAMSLKDAEADLAFLHQLPGKKVLLKGNHDYWWETASKMNRFFKERGWEDFTLLYNNCVLTDGVALCGTRGWEVSAGGEQDLKMLERERQRLEHSLQLAPKGYERVVFFHYPPFDGNHAPFLPLLKKYKVRRCYYGHVHGRKAESTKKVRQKRIRFTLISADALDFKPLLVVKRRISHQNCQKNPSFWAKVLSVFKSKC
ncbi:MAG: metallophosphoesterase [Clostridia bacterium]|nr:metallophosphoesterase [Clostridia bacterium]